MNFFVDCEFDESSNQLISLAIVSEDGKHEFYEVLKWTPPLEPWVVENILPILQKEPLELVEFQNKLKTFCSVQRRNKRLPKDIVNLDWHTSSRRTGINGQTSIISERHNYEDIIDKIKHSLLKDNFGILILQNVIILSDQRCRIFFKEGN